MPVGATNGKRHVWAVPARFGRRIRRARRVSRPGLLRVLLLLGAVGGLALLAYDPGIFFVLLAVGLLAVLLHALATRLAELDLLTPFLIAVGCLAVALCWFMPEDTDLAGEFDRYAPAPVKRLVSSVSHLMLGSDGGAGTTAPSGHAAGGPAVAGNPGRSARPSIAGTPVTTEVPASLPNGAAAAQHAGGGVASPASSDATGRGGQSSTRTRRLQPVATAASSDVHAPVTVTLTSSRSTSHIGEVVLFVVSVTSRKADLLLSGDRVDLCVGPSRIAVAVLVRQQNGYVARFAITSLGAGRHSLTARYAGTHASPASSAPVVHTVLPPGH